VSQQIDRQRLVETLKANHRDPRNLAMHVVGFWFVFRALKRLLTGHFLKAVLNGGIGAGLLIGGHQLEGSDAFAVFKEAAQQRSGNGQLAARV